MFQEDQIGTVNQSIRAIQISSFVEKTQIKEGGLGGDGKQVVLPATFFLSPGGPSPEVISNLESVSN